jgi:hypothetical protein
MKWLKLIALPLFVFSLLLVLTSCEPDAELKKTTDFQKLGIPLTGAQESPAVPSTALGTMDVFYSKETRILTYKISWTGLTGSVAAAHIHGLAPSGFIAPVVQTFSTSAIVKCSSSSTTACGTYSGTLLADEIVVKEQDILNGVYYVNLHTATYPGGEIRGQIKFQ